MPPFFRKFCWIQSPEDWAEVADENTFFFFLLVLLQLMENTRFIHDISMLQRRGSGQSKNRWHILRQCSLNSSDFNTNRHHKM
jgi:hypothetical protein